MKYYIPFTYYKFSRLKGWSDLFSWFIIYPLFLLFFTLLNSSNLELAFFNFLLIFMGFFSIYEIGYLENDLITVQNEKLPTDRLGDEKSFFLGHYLHLKVSRYIVSFLCVSIYCVINDLGFFAFCFFVFYFFITRFCFYLHNSVRNRVNIATYFSLAFLRYSLPVAILFFEGCFNSLDIFILALLFPVLRTIEHSSKPKYAVPFNRLVFNNLDLLRVVYYLILLIAFTFLLNEYVVFVLYFFAYRLATFFIAKAFRIKRTISASYRK